MLTGDSIWSNKKTNTDALLEIIRDIDVFSKNEVFFSFARKWAIPARASFADLRCDFCADSPQSLAFPKFNSG
jgi:hypothetical protein